MENVGLHDAPFIGTGVIHKPIVALTLVRAGLEPLSKNMLVEILPRSAENPGLADVPKIQIIRNTIAKAQNVDGSAGGKFYVTVDPAVVARKYPFSTAQMVVALHTRYK